MALTTPATPLHNAHPGGFFIPIPTMNTYNKIPLTLDEQLSLLESRGLIVKDKQEARHYLQYISYYRLSGYAQAFQDYHSSSTNLTYQTNATFEQVLDSYIFSFLIANFASM